MQRATSPSTWRRRTWRRRLTVVSLTAVVLATTAACRDAASVAEQAPAKGGTLNVILSSRAISNLDPQQVSWANDANFSRLIDRTLTTPNTNGDLVPDLATDTGRPSSNNTVWEFTLKSGVKWEDGSPVTCEDVKYGIERRYAKVVAAGGGLPYPMLYLQDNKVPYKGPFNATAGSLDSIVCIDQKTVQFHLQRSVGDFGYTVSVPTFAPVKTSADGANRSEFNFAPISNGPYRVDKSQLKTEVIDGQKFITTLVLVRNDFWSPGTDSVRKAYPDQIVTTYNPNNAQVTNDLINSTGSNRFAVNLDQSVAPNFVQQVINDPILSKRAIPGSAGGVRYFAINVKNMSNLDCRKALEYGFDKRTWRFVLGGSVFGDLATSMIPPGMPAHSDFDLYETKTFPDGDTDQASQRWKSGGCPASVSLAYPDVPIFHQLVSTVVEAYQRIGVIVRAHAIDPTRYNFLIGDPNNKFDMIYSGWLADWPNGSAIIPPLFDGAQTHGPADQNLNFSEVDDPEINNLIKEAYAEPDLATQYHLWGQIDEKLMDKATVIPIIFPAALRMIGTNVRGAAMAAAFGEPDLATIGVTP